MTDNSVIFSPIEDITGTGKICLEDNAVVVADFRLQILKNGIGIGTIFFSALHHMLNRFSIFGSVTDTKDMVSVEGCQMISSNDTEVKFTYRSLKVSRKSLKTRPQEKIFIHASILNMYQTQNVIVGTGIGQLIIGEYEGIERYENIMRLYNIPLATSFLQIDITSNGSETVEEISSKGENIIEAFLKITSLYQMVWQDWIYMGIYERNTNNLLFFKFSLPKIKSPVSSPLGNRYDANEFINAAWNGYTFDLESKYNFDSALEWFIESNGSDLFETRYLDATTSLEMLMDKFHKQNNSEFLLADTTFNELHKHIRDHSSEFLKSKGIESKLRQSVYSALKGCNRRAYMEKFYMLIENWSIRTDDIGIGLDEIKDIRNKITHEGRYPINSHADFAYAEKVYNGLMTILARLFLAMLNYRKGYLDPWQDRRISEPFCG